MQQEWRTFWRMPQNRKSFLSVVAFLITTLICFFFFLAWNERRQGFVLHDPLLDYFSPLDISLLIFTVTYLCAVAGLLLATRNPAMLQLLLLSYGIMTMFRMLTLLMLPLSPPETIIPLRDLFLEASFYEGRANLRDLFFSGHTATIFLFAFLPGKKFQRLSFMIAGLAVGILVLLQHVHYSIDVLAAPLFAWLSVWTGGVVLKVRSF